VACRRLVLVLGVTTLACGTRTPLLTPDAAMEHGAGEHLPAPDVAPPEAAAEAPADVSPVSDVGAVEAVSDVASVEAVPDAGAGDALDAAAEAPADAPGDAEVGAADASDATDANDASDAADAGDASDAGIEGGCASSGNGHSPRPSPLFGAFVEVDLPGTMGESVAVGDVTGDGRADVVVGGWAGDLIVVYAQTADGGLAPPKKYGDGATLVLGPRQLALGDVNGDGRLDVLYTRDADVGVMLQTAAGTLDAPSSLAPTDAGNGESAVAIGDLDGDGRADVVAAGWGASNVDVWFQDATGALGAAHSFACAHKGYETLALGDIDGDGRADIAVSGRQQSDVCVVLQKPGGLAPSGSIGVGATVSALGIGRLGLPYCAVDLVFSTGGNSPGSGLVVHAVGGTGLGTTLASYDIPESLVVADVDGDGRSDVVVVHTGWEAVGVYRQVVTGGLASEERYPFPYLNWGTDRIAVGDINGDGRPDVVGVDAKLAILYQN
jgi:hypothetical protein